MIFNNNRKVVEVLKEPTRHTATPLQTELSALGMALEWLESREWSRTVILTDSKSMLREIGKGSQLLTSSATNESKGTPICNGSRVTKGSKKMSGQIEQRERRVSFRSWVCQSPHKCKTVHHQGDRPFPKPPSSSLRV